MEIRYVSILYNNTCTYKLLKRSPQGIVWPVVTAQIICWTDKVVSKQILDWSWSGKGVEDLSVLAAMLYNLSFTVDVN